MNGDKFTQGYAVCLCKHCAGKSGKGRHRTWLKRFRVSIARRNNKKVIKDQLTEK